MTVKPERFYTEESIKRIAVKMLDSLKDMDSAIIIDEYNEKQQAYNQETLITAFLRSLN